jgi:Domain of unknown function (DUF4082)/Bacterial Ig domain
VHFSQIRTNVVLAAAVTLLIATLLITAPSAHASCTSPANKIEAENCLPGTPESQWQIVGSGDSTIQGFTTDISVNIGQTVYFKVSTNARAYNLEVYRLGYYGGDGARLITVLTPSAPLPQVQPACLTDNTTMLLDCGNWAVSASWQVPTTATPGLYLIHLVRSDTGAESQIPFVVRDDSSHSNIVYKTSDSTWQAYNSYGGHSLYGATEFDINNRAYKVSYNRPYNTRANSYTSFIYNAEYPMIRWLEANGYDVTYISSIDASRSGNLLTNHKIFMSSGHDEYWDGVERTNVEAARDSGVNLTFFSGNEIFWKTRWENSIDGTNTPYRTMVCYKETFGNAADPQDPPTWTGTWRDPTKSPPADGGRPENALTGTLYKINGPGTDNTDLSMQVPAADGKMRFWRNTSIANLAANQTKTLPAGTLGYEWDIDPLNSVRPAGLFYLSTATYNLTTDYLLDYGGTYGMGAATHHLTMYRAPSGALVFGAGTVQWSWGLDSDHDGDVDPDPDLNMQQATVNLFADMGAQPATPQAGIQLAIKSTDTIPPVSTITSPAEGANVNVGAPIAVSGTGTDSGGGVIAGVEVSTDGGQTWHAAVGRSNWTYSWDPTTVGTAALMSRAVDDSGNLENPQTSGGNPSGGVVANVGPQVCPCTIWNPAVAPGQADGGDGSSIEVGVKFHSDNDGAITGVRFYKATTNTGAHVAHLWSSNGALLASATFTAESASGWQQVLFATPVSISANTTYVVSYYAPVGHYSADVGYFLSQGQDSPPLHALADGVSGHNGVYVYTTNSGTFPTVSYQGTNYWVDVVFVSGTTFDLGGRIAGIGGGGATVSLSGTLNTGTTADANGNYNFAGIVNGTYTITPSNPGVTFTPVTQTVTLNGLSLNNVSFTASVVNPMSISGTISGGAGAAVYLTGPASVSVNADSSGNYTFTGLLAGTYFVTPALAGYIFTPNSQQVTLTSSSAMGVNFTSQLCPCTTIWQPSATPVVADSGDNASVEVGVRFRSDVAGQIQALRFYKASANTGTHIAHVWSDTGTLLGSATFTNESTSGWQEVVFVDPIAITPNTAYVASYFAPAGHYSFDAHYFATSGVDTPPLHAYPDVYGSVNGIYSYSSTPIFPNSGYQSSNYWVDVVFMPSPPHNISGTITGAGGPGATVTLSGGTTVSTIADASGNFGFSNVYDGTYVVTPSNQGFAFTAGSKSVTLSGTDVTGIAFGTLPNCAPCDGVWQGTSAPVASDSGDGTSVNVGVKFRTDADGYVVGVRFYKSALNTGTHVGTLWTATGTPLASVTFSGESSFGWQQATFASPVLILANTTYVISYFAPNGHYAADLNAFASAGIDSAPLHALANAVDGPDGVYAYGSGSVFPNSWYLAANYWVDVLFTPTASTHAVSGTISGPGGANATVNLMGSVSATTTTDINGNFTFSGLADGTYWVTPNRTGFAFSPGNQTLIVAGTDVHGVNFAALQNCPCSTIWAPSAVPALSDGGDSVAVNVGIKFTSDTDGYIVGLRFYKSALNTGIHIGALWSDSGTQLATATFTGESASGWQQVLFDTAVPVSANTTYIASYLAPVGHYAADLNYFTNNGIDNPPLHALMNGVDGGNAVFTYASTPAFPNQSYQAANYWVDVIYATSASYSIAGSISGPSGPGATLLLSGASSTTITADASANYSFGGLQNGTYTVTPVSNVYAFSPASQTITVSNAHVLNVNFTSGFGISGAITGPGGAGATVALSGASSATTTADGAGNYTFTGLANGSYTVTPSNGSYAFSPPSQITTINSASISAFNFGSVGVASITFNPSSVTAGSSSTGTVTLSAPAPSNGAVVTLSSTNTTAAQIPATVTLGAGATTASFTVTTSAVATNTPITISATLGTTQSATFTVTSVALASLTLNPTSVSGGVNSTGTVTLNAPAPTGGAVVTLSSSNTAAAQVPASVTVAANATTATFTVTTAPVASNTSLTISATYNTTQSIGFTVTPPVSSSVTLNPTSVPGGANSTGTVTLNGPAPAGGALVTLSSNNTAAAQVPASVTVAANATTATFAVSTSVVSANTTATISATYGATKTATLTVVGSLSTVSVNPTSVLGGTSSTGTVTLAGAAPTGGAVVTLSSSNTAAAQVPATVTVAAGATTATFTVTTSAVASSASATITGTYGVARTATLTVTPPTLTSVSLNPTSVLGGNSSTCTVTLTGRAPTGGAVVTLSSNNTAAATVPASVTVAAGATTATFTVTTSVVASSTTATISGTYGVTKTVNLTVTPPTLSGNGNAVTVSPASVIGGTSSTGTVRLTGPAPAGGAVVSLSSSNTAAAQTPSNVTVAAGATTATFTITTSPVASNASATVTAVYGVTRTATLTVTAATLSSVTLSPTSVIGGTSSTGTVTLTGRAPAGGAVVTLSSSNTAAAQLPASVTVAAGATTATFTVTTSAVTSNASVTTTGTYGIARTATLTVQTPVATSLTLNPSSVKGGSTSTGTVTISGPAPAAGTVVTLSSNTTSVATVPANVTVAAGNTTATFTVTTKTVLLTRTVTISATKGTAANAALTVTP